MLRTVKYGIPSDDLLQLTLINTHQHPGCTVLQGAHSSTQKPDPTCATTDVRGPGAGRSGDSPGAAGRAQAGFFAFTA